MQSLLSQQCYAKGAFKCRPSGPSRTRSVQVLAKGKGKSRFSPEPMSLKNLQRSGGGEFQGPPVPAVDPENEELVVFVRTKKATAWAPINIISGKGSPQLNLLIKSCETGWGRALFQNFIIRSVAAQIYKDRKALEKMVRKGNMALYGNTPGGEFEFGLKIRDKADPKAWMDSAGVTPFPPEAEAALTPLDNITRFLSQATGGAAAPATLPAASAPSDADAPKQA